MVSIKWWKTIKKVSESKKTSRKPKNTAFRQQRLKAWQPILSPQSVLPLLIFVACIFAPIGVGLLVSTFQVQSLVVDYTDCDLLANKNSYVPIPHTKLHHQFKKKWKQWPEWRLDSNAKGVSICKIRFEVPNHLKKSVYMYYKMTRFHQNHRKMVEAFDKDQLKGKPVEGDALDKNCDPLKMIGDKIVYPCGLTANALFNDSYSEVFSGQDGTADFIMTKNGTNWRTDRHRYGKTQYNASQIVPPPFWAEMFPDGYTDDNIPDLTQWPEFQIWMRTAALPSFYKMALKNDTHDMPKGTYELDIVMNYPVRSFKGTKSIVLTTNSIIGALNIALGIIYLVVAVIATLFAVIFLLKILIQPTDISGHMYLNYETRDQDSFISRNSDTIPLREIL
ncbi:hypothetical protein RNJ44_00410 [Nakaseomyces bracarensis]|uniref:Cell division control protein 50 n=1 Tax=Nakaseomyces bracarensis TaxID=273131 RepID=A0ABR4NSQ0_9SACH